jgi:hypothetical protein
MENKFLAGDRSYFQEKVDIDPAFETACCSLEKFFSFPTREHLFAAGFRLFNILDGLNTNEMEPLIFAHYKEHENDPRMFWVHSFPLCTRTQRIRLDQATNQLVKRIKLGAKTWDDIKSGPLNPKK